MTQNYQGNGNGELQQIEEVMHNIQEKINQNKTPFLFLVIIILLALWLLTCVYTVDVDEMGVVQRFGQYVRTEPPGLNFKLPAGIEKVTNVRSKPVHKQEFGFKTLQAGVRTQYAPSRAYLGESLMLTGDLNVAIVPWIVQYVIKDERAYLFEVKNPEKTLRDLSESTMRLVVGDRSINEVLRKRQEIADQAKVMLQEELNKAQTGIVVTTIEMKNTNVPEQVQASFNEVNQSMQEKERMIYEAKEQYNKVIPKAKGSAEKTISAAEGYALDRINRAKGDTARFLSLYKEYKTSQDVTKRRLYLETMKKLLPKMGKKYIVDEDQKNVLPLLNLQEQGKGVSQ